MKTLTMLLSLVACLTAPNGTFAEEIVADDLICQSCVNGIDISNRAVISRHIRLDAVTAHAIQDGSIDWQELAASLQNRIIDLESRLAALESNSVLELDGHLNLDDSDPQRPSAVFSGLNVQVVNGTGNSDQFNGVGNLLLGYDEAYPAGPDYAICSDGSYLDEETCVANGNVWSDIHKSGSHNLVVGKYHRYSQANGIIAGRFNAVNTSSSSVIGGSGNVASGWVSVIVGGKENTALGEGSAIGGGYDNLADASYSSVVGGINNIAGGQGAVVTGGSWNTAMGSASAVSGGHERSVDGARDWRAGTLFEDE